MTVAKTHLFTDETGQDIRDALERMASDSAPTKTSELENDEGWTSNEGTVTAVTAGVGLAGGTVNTSGTIKAALKSETQAASNASVESIESGRYYAVTPDASGHLAVSVPWEDTTYGSATQSEAGLMSAADKEKLDGVAAGATDNIGTITQITTTSPLSGSGTSGAVTIRHADSGVAAGSKGDSTNQAPAFGGTFKSVSATVDSKGHVTDFEEHTVTIPNTTANSGADGLMTSSDKSKLDGVESGAEVNQNAFANISDGTNTIVADAKSDTLSITGGSNVTVSADPSNETVTISATDTTYSPATASADGLMTSAQYSKLAGVEEGAQVHIAPTSAEITEALGYTPAQSTDLGGYIPTTQKGAANGVAELGSDGKVPSTQLPSYVDDVVEADDFASLPSTGEAGKIYVTKDDNKTYRWSGSGYVEISASLALGNTSSTAYRGDYGEAAYEHATDENRLSTAQASGLYKVAATAEGHVASLTAVQKSDITALGVPEQDTTYSGVDGQIEVNANDEIGLSEVGTAGTAGSSTAQAPAFGGSATVPYLTTDAYGRVTGKGEANVTIPNSVATTDANGLMSSTDKSKLDGVSAGAEVNQNAYSNIEVGETTISADGKTGTFTLAAGSNVTLSADAATDTITISSDNTSYSEATDEAAGLMSAADKTKLDGIESNATANIGTITQVSTVTPLSGSATSGAVTIRHADSGVTAGSKGDSENQTPSFGGTFKSISATVDSKGHVTDFAEHTVMVPNDEATSSAAGLMSASDKEKLDGIEDNATANIGTITSVDATGVLSGGGTSGDVTVTHDTSGVNAGAYGPSANQTPSFGDSVTVPQVTFNDTGHATEAASRTVTIPNSEASATAAGLMSADDKTKLDGVAAGATANEGTITQVTTVTPLSGSATSGAVTIRHADSGVTAGSKGDTAAQTPAFGGTFKALSATVDAKGHVTDFDEHLVTIPDSEATASAAGLMSSTDKSKLDGIASGATANTGTVTSVSGANGLTGSVTTTGSISADLVSNAKLENSAAAATETAGRVYPVAMDADGKLAVNVPWSDTTALGSMSGTLGVAHGGTGANTLTGIVKGNGESAMTAASATDVTNLLGATPVARATADADGTAFSTGYLKSSLKGAASGLAELDANGTVPSAQLPSFVDDVLEFNGTSAFPATGETGKIYVDTSTNKTYRWSGTQYTTIGSDLALGTTSSTAFRGDYGNTAYGHATDGSRLTTATAAGLYKVGVTAEGHVSALTAVAKSDITALGIPAQDTTYSSLAAASGGTDVSLVTTGDKYNWNSKTSNTGTVTSVSGATGLTGTVSTSGSLKANLRSETALTNASAAGTETAGRVYPVALDKDGYLAVNVPWTDEDTHHTAYLRAGASGGTSNASTTTGNTYLNLVENGSNRSGVKLNPGSNMAITSDANGNVTFAATDTTYSNGTGIALSGTTFSLASGVATAGTAGQTTAQSPSYSGSFSIPYVTVDTYGRVTGYGTSTVNFPAAPSVSVTQTLTSGHAIGAVSGTTLYSAPGSWYGSCSTAAGTAAKVVTCSGFSLVEGARVKVYFSYANTYASGALTLNVNSTGAKNIYIDDVVTSTSNKMFWYAGAYIEFVYCGSYWRVADSATSYYGSCTTAAATYAKVCSITYAVVRRGTRVTLQMSYEHTSTTAATLNICNNTSTACTIYDGSNTITSTNENSWYAGAPITLVFDGTYWRMESGKTTWGQLAK